MDLLGEVPGIPSYDSLADNAEDIELFGQRVKVANLDDLIRMKEAANRPKDQVHLLELRALKASKDSNN